MPKKTILLYLTLLVFLSEVSFAKNTCTYEYSVWNTKSNAVGKRIRVDKGRLNLDESEKGPLGCTPCEEDQKEMTLSNGLKFKICSKISKKIKKSLDKLIRQRIKIHSVMGYRPSVSRGPIDAEGNRTLFSDHTFGTSLDINRETNGMYYNCFSWGPSCQLIQGGDYAPENSASFTQDHELVKTLKAQGWVWGGEWEGQIKDFMHFSAQAD